MGGPMREMASRCGYRCDLCMAYAPNLESHPENRQLLSDGWFKSLASVFLRSRSAATAAFPAATDSSIQRARCVPA